MVRSMTAQHRNLGVGALIQAVNELILLKNGD